MKKLLCIFSLFLLFSLNAVSQFNADSLFASAIEHSKSKEYAQAIQEAKTVFATDTNRADVILFIANLYAWQGDYSTATIYVNKAYAIAPQNSELYEPWLNILLWSKDYEKLLEIVDVAVAHGYSNSYDIVLKKLLAYKELEQYANGISYAQTISPALLDSAQIKIVYSELEILQKQKFVSAFYSVDFFDANNPTPQQLAYIDYGFKIKKNTLILRLNYANRYNKSDFQPELDYYQIFNKDTYFYINYGVGLYHNLFPQHRFGLEYYFPLEHKFDASIGGRYLNFGNTNVYIVTGHISKNFAQSWLSFKPFYVFLNNGNIFSARLNYRQYGKKTFDYWGLELGYGNSPDDAHLVYQSNNLLRLQAYSVKFEKNISFKNSNELKLSVGYALEEYVKTNYNNRYIAELILKHKF